ncbi:MAG: asparagine synthase (glutamine-hydrolyzing) [Candidatus Omnitrophica bacterium]|nr:asparagine synthase (glutamine-hydrolyzing) [Candidatus Omnitrophota bacterium]
MCGFSGFIHWEAEPIPSDELTRAAGLIRHRGPDELCAAMPSDGVGLVHARLRVIDLSDAARQPMSNEDRSVWLLYNGEIYNFRELRRELAALGHPFRSQSDTEVILRAYEAWGSEAIRRLDGMFALALWDGGKRELLLARDRVGKKPLYYWTDGRCIAFGSQIQGLLVHRHVPREVNEPALPFLMAFGYPPAGQTCYRGIQQVPPACWIRFRAGQADPVPQTYWDLEIASRPGRADPGEAARRLRHFLAQAVRRRMIADVPLGAFLSGGVDSTIVVGLMAESAPDRPVKTFSIGFEGDPRFNETHYAEIAARRFRTDHTVFTVTPQSFDLLERLVSYHDQPFGDSSAVPAYLLSELTRQQVTVALTGDGGDELFAGYTRFWAALAAERVPGSVWAGMDLLLRGIPSGSERSLISRAKRFLKVARLPLPERYWQWISYFGREGLSHLDPSLERWWARSEGWTPLSRLLYLNFKEYLPNDLMVKMDRCSMAHGLEARSPFLDTALIEYAASLPDRFKLGGGGTKVLLKLACGDLLPPEIHRRGKMGFGVPLGSWFRGKWREPLKELLEPSSARIHRYLGPAAVRDLVSLHLGGREDAGHRLWLLLTLEVWLRQMAGSSDPAAGRAEVIWLNRQKEEVPHG